MKIRQILLTVFLVIVIAAYANSEPNSKQGLFQKIFIPPYTETQMLDWLKEQGYKVEKLDNDLYTISWKHQLPDGKLDDVYGKDVCNVLIESVNSKNTAHFTYTLRLKNDINVVVSSEVEWIENSSSFRFYYSIEGLSTSNRPVNRFQIDLNDSVRARNITNPSELWEDRIVRNLNSERGDVRSIVWRKKGIGIIRGESQHGFAFDGDTSDSSENIMPGIFTARVDINRYSPRLYPTIQVNGQVANRESLPGHDPEIIPSEFVHVITVKIDGKSFWVESDEKVQEILLRIRPQGKVVGPDVLSGGSVLSYIQRLRMLTSQCAAEGWLDKNGVRLLNQHLSTALQNVDLMAQVEEGIGKFLDELEQMQTGRIGSKPSLTQEAATLLRTNADYILKLIESESKDSSE